MPTTVLHKDKTRGHADHGWLQARHSFSFANYYDPTRIHFGVLRVLNDDTVAPGRGFGMHPHDNMEIITIPLEGDLEHKDSMGNSAVIRQGDIQVMSAGTGVYHSEYNKNKDKPIKLLQIWVFPNKRNVAPRYDQITLDPTDRVNKFQQIVSPNPDDEGVWIHQQAWFHLADFEPGHTAEYPIHAPGNGLYVFVINGQLNVNGQALDTRDGYGLWEVDSVRIAAEQQTEFLLMEVPMEI